MMLESVSPSTRRVYVKVIVEFQDFVKKLEVSLSRFPVSPMHVGLFVAHLFKKGQAPSSIATKLSAIAF